MPIYTYLFKLSVNIIETLLFQVIQNSLLLSHQKMVLSGFQMFSINRNLAYSFMGTILVFLTIVAQNDIESNGQQKYALY
ncbi:hypothetical protein FQR65_LT00689 [Abscondita terminalis]|nr:hypothetical protein FQR65_LT00689 [Abscondita terminalis]